MLKKFVLFGSARLDPDRLRFSRGSFFPLFCGENGFFGWFDWFGSFVPGSWFLVPDRVRFVRFGLLGLLGSVRWPAVLISFSVLRFPFSVLLFS